MQRPLQLQIEKFSGSPGAGLLRFVNETDRRVRIWDSGNSWGDAALLFELSLDGRVTKIVRWQRYTRNVPHSIEIPPRGAYEVSFDFGDGTWKADGPFDDRARRRASLVAVYSPKDSPEARSNDVWIGEVRSPAVSRV
jgi:hypothetical protein